MLCNKILLDNADDFVGSKKCFNDDDCKSHNSTCNFYHGNSSHDNTKLTV